MKSKQAKQQLEAAYKEWRRENGLPEMEPGTSTVDLSSEEIRESESSPKRFNIFDNLRFPKLL
jgi:NADPH-dependent 7-cyano-7-deazaguanine reductase QueF-like protein